jgi:ABC-type sulfate/molybdate transport systems ATPase subunit
MTLKCIAGLVTPDQGEIILNDKIFVLFKEKNKPYATKKNVDLCFKAMLGS